MQRSAWVVLGGLLFSVGCAPQARPVALGPLPDPVLQTRAPARPVRPVTPAQPTKRSAAPRVVTPTRIPRGWIPPGGVAPGRWQVIVVHHSATPKASPHSMDEYHRTQRGWSNGLGYHFVIGNGVNYPDGAVYVGHRWTKQQTGAHCKSGRGRFFGAWRPDNYFNDRGIGICLVGNFEQERPSRRQLVALRQLLRFLCDEADIDPRRIYGHGEVTGKTLCPGRNVNMHAIRRTVSAPSSSSAPPRSFGLLARTAPALLVAISVMSCFCLLARSVRPERPLLNRRAT